MCPNQCLLQINWYLEVSSLTIHPDEPSLNYAVHEIRNQTHDQLIASLTLQRPFKHDLFFDRMDHYRSLFPLLLSFQPLTANMFCIKFCR